MTQPEDTGDQSAAGQPAHDQSHPAQDGGSPAPAPAAAPPPPGSWHFPPQPIPPYDPATAAQPYRAPGAPAPPDDAQAYPGQAAPGQPGPGQPAPGQPGPGQPGPGQAYPGQPGPGQPGPGQAYPGQPAPGQAYPGQPGPGQAYTGPGQPYGPPPPPYVQTPYSAPQPQYGAPPYGAPQQPYGAPQQPYGAPYPQYPGGPVYVAGPEPDLAGRWRRLLARIIDIVILAVVLIPLSIPMLRRPLDNLQQVTNRYPNVSAPGAQAAIARADGKLLGALAVFAIVGAIITFLYDWPQHALWGQTLGKRALRTRVVTAGGRAPIHAATAAKRSAVYALVPIVPLLGGLFALLNEAWCLWDPRRQCLHDKAARTIVIRTDMPRTWPQPGPWG